ncbi:hypothetical protein cyc_09764 [Cyclospora cayetanensis]|uniref:Uncharacterized protein n=1 Tax=Cyclospora cayetanensis TaxID=88456 RepID=A0A1D3CST4_9EIME|nr:hypothetical protein cyc_09764 [Cyclospora cayetanensis]
MLIRGRMYSDQGGQWSPSPPPGPKCALEEPHDAQGVAFKVHLGYHKTKAAGGSHHMLSDDGAIPDDAEAECTAIKVGNGPLVPLLDRSAPLKNPTMHRESPSKSTSVTIRQKPPEDPTTCSQMMGRSQTTQVYLTAKTTT